MLSNAERAANLSRQLLAHSGRGRFYVQDADASSVIAEMRDFLRVSVLKTVELRLNSRTGSEILLGGSELTDNGISMLTVNTTVEIDASTDRVWRHLIDLPRYEEWNPFITYVGGPSVPLVGSAYRARVVLPGIGSRVRRIRVTTILENQELGWTFPLISTLAFADHVFHLHPVSESRIRLRSESLVVGLGTIFAKKMAGPISAGMEAMNAALKRRAETV